MAINPATHQQPDPVPNNQPYAVDRLCEFLENFWVKGHFPQVYRSDLIGKLKHRKQLGIDRYGVALQAFNGRDVEKDIDDELLDALIYCQQGIDEGKHHLKWLRTSLYYLIMEFGEEVKREGGKNSIPSPSSQP